MALQPTQILTMNWNKKHDQFALSCNLSESQQLVLRDALRKCRSEPTEIEFDLRVTNRWIGKVRSLGEYHRKTITNAPAALDEKSMGMFVILKRYSPWVYRVLVRPLDFVERIQRAKCDSPHIPTTPNPMFDAAYKKEALKQQQQDISKLDSLFRKVGIIYDRDALLRVWRLAGKKVDTVVSAIEMLLYRHSTQTKPIGNPQGWIINCLTKGLQNSFDLLYQPELPQFESATAIANFVRGNLATVGVNCPTVRVE